VSATATESPPTRRCPHCDAPMAPEQDWCLECGVAVTTRVARPPGWGVPVAIVVAALVIAGAAVFITIGLLTDDSNDAAGGESRAAATPPARTAPAKRSTPTKTTGSAAKRTTPGTPAAAAPTVPGATEAQGGGPVPLWPRGKNAYTIVIAAPSSRAAAESQARAVIALGRDAGILRSDDYDFFGGGVWVVWRGQYPDRAKADKAGPKVRKVYPSAYVTFVRRKTS
jgi:hypothetical protein